jgi:hypothetical protein
MKSKKSNSISSCSHGSVNRSYACPTSQAKGEISLVARPFIVRGTLTSKPPEPTQTQAVRPWIPMELRDALVAYHGCYFDSAPCCLHSGILGGMVFIFSVDFACLTPSRIHSCTERAGIIQQYTRSLPMVWPEDKTSLIINHETKWNLIFNSIIRVQSVVSLKEDDQRLDKGVWLVMLHGESCNNCTKLRSVLEVIQNAMQFVHDLQILYCGLFPHFKLSLPGDSSGLHAYNIVWARGNA